MRKDGPNYAGNVKQSPQSVQRPWARWGWQGRQRAGRFGDLRNFRTCSIGFAQ